MTVKTVEDVYAANAAAREKLKTMIATLSDHQLKMVLEGEKWSISDIVEHLTMVEESAIRICSKLLSKAVEDGRKGNGMITLSETFLVKGVEVSTEKLEAPEIVHPSGKKTLAELMESFESNSKALGQLKQLFETVDSTEQKFPHPYFGKLSAGEWLTLIGAHELRHVRQIRSIMERT